MTENGTTGSAAGQHVRNWDKKMGGGDLGEKASCATGLLDEPPPVWDVSTQSPHGGQDWRSLPNYVEDFSVTTNPLGSPKDAVIAAQHALLHEIHHYPAADFEPARSHLARFLTCETGEVRRSQGNCNSSSTTSSSSSLVDDTPKQTAQTATTQRNTKTHTSSSDGTEETTPFGTTKRMLSLRERLVLGNGASECIDLCTRLHKGSTWKPGPFSTQYQEYERSCTACGKQKCARDDLSASLLCMVNPCNPTGEFLPMKELKQYINQQCQDGTTVVVDESMLPWLGSHWREESLVSQGEWITDLLRRRNISVYVIHSWTKLWACPGLRIGSVVTPTAEHAGSMKRIQAPWSVNSMALSFIAEVVYDNQYLERSWKLTPIWRKHLEDGIRKLHPSWLIIGVSWITFLWIDTRDTNVAQAYSRLCRKAGVPIRWGGDGYKMSSYIRLGVRAPAKADVLLRVLSTPEEEALRTAV